MLWGSAGLMVGLLIRQWRMGTLRSFPIYDMTAEARPSSKAAPYVRTRDPSKVYAVVLHQMGFSRGNDPRKYRRVTGHYVILPDGGIYQLYAPSVRLPAANGFNSGSVSVEFAGNFPSRARSTNPNHWWFPSGRKGDPKYMNQVTTAQVQAGRFLLRHLQGQGYTHVLAHRQSSGQRGNDPGPDLWGGVGEYGVRDLGLSDGGPDFAVGSGKPIRQGWRDAYALWKTAIA